MGPGFLRKAPAILPIAFCILALGGTVQAEGDEGEPQSIEIGALVEELIAARNSDETPQNKREEYIGLTTDYAPGLVAAEVVGRMTESGPLPIARDELLKVHQVEMERTDKQVGASSRSSGSTSVAEKPGLAWLLALAVENGAITQEENESGVTLSTSPYAFLTLGMLDTPRVYTKYEYIRRLGLAATFGLDGGGTAEDRNFDPTALTELSAKYVVYGDRSSRSRWFHERWKKDISKFVVGRLGADQMLQKEIASVPYLKGFVSKAEDELPSIVLAAVPAAEVEGEEDRLRAVIEDSLDEILEGFDPSVVPPGGAERVIAAAREVVRTRQQLPDEVAAIKKLLAEAKRRPEVTAAYTFHRKEDDADFSELKLLAECTTELVTFVGNASISLNHDDSVVPGTAEPAEGDMPADKGKKRDTVRDYSISLSLEKKIPNFLPFRGNQIGTEEILLSLSGKVMRLEDENDEIGVGQAKASFPLATGVDLPISVTYATRSEYVDEDEIRGNFGISVDTDKLWSLAKLATGGE